MDQERPVGQVGPVPTEEVTTDPVANPINA